MAHKKLDWIQFEIFKVQKKLHTKHFRKLGWNGWSQHPHDQKNKLHQISVYNVAISYKSKRVSSEWTFELQEMLPKKCSLERGKRQKSLMRTNGLMNWQCSTEQMLIFSGESKLHWESQFHSISETWQEEATTEAPSEAGARLPDFRFFEYNSATARCQETCFFLDVPSRMCRKCESSQVGREFVTRVSCSQSCSGGAECATACWSACSSWRANRTANGRANGLTPKTWQRSAKWDVHGCAWISCLKHFTWMQIIQANPSDSNLTIFGNWETCEWTNLFPLHGSELQGATLSVIASLNVLKAFVRRELNAIIQSTFTRKRMRPMWFVCVGNVCGGSSTPEDDDDDAEEGGWCRFLFHCLQYSPSWLSNVRRFAMNIEKVSWLHTMTQDLFWHWLLTSTALAVTDLTLLFLVRFAGRETKGVELHLDAGRRQVWPRKLLWAVSNAPGCTRFLDQSITWFDNSKI